MANQSRDWLYQFAAAVPKKKIEVVGLNMQELFLSIID